MVPPELAGVYRLWWLVTIIGEAAQRVKPREDRQHERIANINALRRRAPSSWPQSP
jgi:hypothetical protein